MIQKISIRYFNNCAVRAVWNDVEMCWFYVAVDVINALIETKNARKYWNALKTRNSELSSFCRQLKVTAADQKAYNTDCLNQEGINLLLLRLSAKNRINFAKWINGLMDPIDEQSKRNAYELYDNSILADIEVGTINGLQQIHAFIFGGLYNFAGKIRSKNISKGGFIFANCLYFKEIFATINSMPDSSFDEIIAKYIEVNIAHPFMEGNGRATRIWLDALLKIRIGKCVDWQKINKKDYLLAMEQSPNDAGIIKSLIANALTDKTGDREIFMKGIDYSYYYETIEE